MKAIFERREKDDLPGNPNDEEKLLNSQYFDSSKEKMNYEE
jgi:hypothetical protein